MSNTSKIISEWFYQYSDCVYDFLVYYTGSKDVEDLVQEVFIKAGKGLKSYKEEASPKTWLFSIARHVAIDHARKKETRLSKHAKPFDEHIRKNHLESSPEEILLENEQNQALYQAINNQKKSYRDVLILRGIQGLSVKETAAILNWKETKVRTNFHRAMKAIRMVQGGRIYNEE
ncbi:RNA polymerase sigma factor [Aquibacillus koreensis]|uniref:RNA polymerase sigma factor n=1 Tax=Aquibacillus koreensis TaxID=279446 RepID=A0A9X4ALM2_9BACI|nr:RNA polymerase sigma factor [Aquibacillus koreensis]MCT2534198.1 RNA polymerase sigma factor [Aquibacillus koreensis]MDC3422590.1 RNA polymerase sigma factor [Aquibacillus koreensis]